MSTLFINIASHTALIALVSDDAVVSHKTVTGTVGDDALVPLIEEVCSYDQIDRIACVVGPGGFTSLRVGVTCANVLADQLDVPLTGIHLADLYRARWMTASRCLWIHSTKRSEVFVCDYSEQWKEPTHLTLDDLTPQLREYDQWCGELIDDHRALVDEHGLKEVELEPMVDVLPAFLKPLTYKKESLEPWYGRGW